MKNGIAVLALLLLSVAAFAEDNSEDQADVWDIIEKQWDADENGDHKWIDRMLLADFSGWSKNAPAPRDKASTLMWDRFADTQGKTVAHELYPLAIIVRDDVAIAHYLYSAAFENKKGETKVSNGRYTDTLVRTSSGWKFLGWHGGED